MSLTGPVIALNLTGVCIASLAVVQLRAVAALVRSRGLKRAWRAMTAVILCCIALSLVSTAMSASKSLDAGDLVTSTLNVLGPSFVLSVAWLSRRTAVDLLRVAALEEAAFADALTGLANRRRFDECLSDEVARARAAGLPMSLAVLDIDHFKRVNDSHGHAVGDLLIRRVAASISAKARPRDTVCRVGGEEFVVILPGLEGAFAAAVAERLRRAVAEDALPLDGGGEIRATVSLGLASLYPDETPDQLFRRADAALYGAKRGGRDRVCLAA